MSKKKSGRRVWRGVTTATASLLAAFVEGLGEEGGAFLAD